MAISHVGSVSNNYTVAGDIGVDFSSVDWEADDLVIIQAFSESNGGNAFSYPTGWNALVNDTLHGLKHIVAYRFLTSGDDDTPAFNNGHGSADEGAYSASIYRGVHKGLGFTEGLAFNGGNLILTTIPDSAALVDDSLSVLLYMADRNEITALVDPADYTERINLVANHGNLLVCDKSVDTGTVDAGEWAHTGTASATQSISHHIVLTPADKLTLAADVIGYTFVETGAGTSLTPDFSEIAWEEDDLAIAFGTVDGDGGGSMTAATDWTLVRQDATAAGNDRNVGLFRKKLETGDDETPTFTLSTGGPELSMALVIVRGIDPDTPFDVTETYEDSVDSGNAAAPDITNVNKSLILVYGYANGSTTYDAVRAPAGYYNGPHGVGISMSKRMGHMAFTSVDEAGTVDPGVWRAQDADSLEDTSLYTIALRVADGYEPINTPAEDDASTGSAAHWVPLHLVPQLEDRMIRKVRKRPSMIPPDLVDNT